MKKYQCYILWTESARKFYIGITEDLDHRLQQHNAGESKWTKRFAGSWKCVWHKEFQNLSAARKFENTLKKQKKGIGFYKLTGLNKDRFHE
ncbi:MAG: GIY-YIG nuclease family protein [Kiritimatiellae bacterium]|jgi:putative endonuclease|nr:GIY-YIG nuclease family protein [Kiritimatiellia bacterium]